MMAWAGNRKKHFYWLLRCVSAWCVKSLFVQVFRISGEEILSHVSCLPYFLLPNHFYTLPIASSPASTTTKCLDLEDAKAHLVWWLSRPCNCWTHFLAEHQALWSRLFPLLWRRVAMTGPISPCSIGRFFLLEDSLTCNSGLKLVQALRPVPGWITLQVSFETLDRSALPSLFLPAGLPVRIPAFLHFSFLLILQKSTEDAQVDLGKFKLHKVLNCVCFTKLLWGLSCLHKARPRLLNINCRHSFQSCPTASIPWCYVAMIMNVLAGWFSLSDYFLKWRYFCSNFVSIFSHDMVICRKCPTLIPWGKHETSQSMISTKLQPFPVHERLSHIYRTWLPTAWCSEIGSSDFTRCM